MLSRAWKETQSDTASRSHTVNPILPILHPPPPRLLCLLGKTSVLSSAHFSRLSAVHNHETACGILQFNTPLLNRATRGSGSPQETGLIQSLSAPRRRTAHTLISLLNAFRPSRSPHLSPLLRLVVIFRCTVAALQTSSVPTPGYTSRHKSTTSTIQLHQSVSLLRLPALISIPNTEMEPPLSQLLVEKMFVNPADA